MTGVAGVGVSGLGITGLAGVGIGIGDYCVSLGVLLEVSETFSGSG